MQRTKLYAVVVAMVMAVAAAVVVAGGASAASWHVYQGDLFAGHAYGLEVPADAEGVEFLFEGAATGRAAISVFDPEGEKVGHYELSPDLTTAAVANPDAGEYVVYVYELEEGALTVRVNAESEPPLDLAEIDLVREDVSLGTFEPGALDKVVTTELDTTPVFLTLLYEGSSRGLDATVASEKGTVVTITDESGTAFSPGVWTSLQGERAATPANLDGVQYTVTLHAESFEGEMVLTTLALDLDGDEGWMGMPMMPGMPGQRPSEHEEHEHHSHHSASSAPMAAGTFAAPPERAIAFQATAGKLLLFYPVVHEDEDQECYDCGYTTLSVYAPDDSVLAFVELTPDEPTAEVDLPADGEYVLFSHGVRDAMVLAKLESGEVPTLRDLDLAEEIVEIDVGLGGDEVAFTLANVPVGMSLAFDGVGALGMASASNEIGQVVRGDYLTGLPGFGITGGSMDLPENFAAGEHTLRVDGAFEGTIEIVSVHYLRDAEAPVEETPAPEADAEEEADEESWLPLALPRLPKLPL